MRARRVTAGRQMGDVAAATGFPTDVLRRRTEEPDLGSVARDTGLHVPRVTSDAAAPGAPAMPVHADDVGATCPEVQERGYDVVPRHRGGPGATSR